MTARVRTSLRRAGFTLVEILVVVAIIGILARIAIPRLHAMKNRARAAAIVADLEVIRNAAYLSLEETGVWPANAATGTIPAAMKKHLPGNLSFSKSADLQYDWRMSGMSGGNPSNATASTSMGMGASTTDLELRAELQRRLANQQTLVTGGIVYWLLWGPTSKP